MEDFRKITVVDRNSNYERIIRENQLYKSENNWQYKGIGLVFVLVIGGLLFYFSHRNGKKNMNPAILNTGWDLVDEEAVNKLQDFLDKI